MDILAHRRRFGEPDAYGSEGYTGYGVEAVGRSLVGGDVVVVVDESTNATPPADAVESFAFLTLPPASPADEPTRPLAGLVELSRAARAYYGGAMRVLDAVHRITADVFGVDAAQDSLFAADASGSDSGIFLRFAHYPEYLVEDPTDAAGPLRYALHTDYLTFTILRATEPGLQLLGADGAFRDVVPAPDALIVNAGDLAELWANGRWRSAPHRVVPTPKDGAAEDRLGAPFVSRERSAIAFFTGPAHAALVTPVVADGDVARFDPVIAGDYLRMKIDPTTTVTTTTTTACAAEDGVCAS